MKCINCGSQEYKELSSYDKPDQYEQAVGIDDKAYSRKWVECNRCGLRYSVYSRDDKCMDKIYESSYRSNESPWRNQNPEELFKKIIDLPENESETKFRINWIKNHIRNMVESGIIQKQDSMKLLDVGGGTGVFAYEFQDKEWRSYIIDPNEGGKFVEKYDIPFVQGYYKPGAFDTKFSLISFVFVLEHLTDPISILKMVKGDMTPESLIYIEVPDSICFQLKPKDDDIFNSCHLWMFNANTLTSVVDKCGFDVMAVERVKTRRGHYALMMLAKKK